MIQTKSSTNQLGYQNKKKLPFKEKSRNDSTKIDVIIRLFVCFSDPHHSQQHGKHQQKHHHQHHNEIIERIDEVIELVDCGGRDLGFCDMSSKYPG